MRFELNPMCRQYDHRFYEISQLSSYNVKTRTMDNLCASGPKEQNDYQRYKDAYERSSLIQRGRLSSRFEEEEKICTLGHETDIMRGSSENLQDQGDAPRMTVPLPSRAICQFSTRYSRNEDERRMENSGFVGSGRSIRKASRALQPSSSASSPSSVYISILET